MLAVLFALVLATPPPVLSVHTLFPAEPYATEEQLLWVSELAKCESGGNDSVVVLDTNGLYSRGRFQFQLRTWLAYGKKFGATKENIFDGELQEKVVIEMLNNGGAGHWYNCNKIVVKKLGVYPRDI